MALKPKDKKGDNDAAMQAVEDALSVEFENVEPGKAATEKSEAKTPPGTGSQTGGEGIAKNTVVHANRPPTVKTGSGDIDDSDIDMGKLEQKLASVANDMRDMENPGKTGSKEATFDEEINDVLEALNSAFFLKWES